MPMDASDLVLGPLGQVIKKNLPGTKKGEIKTYDSTFLKQYQDDLNKLSTKDFREKYGKHGSAKYHENQKRYLEALAQSGETEAKIEKAQAPLPSEPFNTGANASASSGNQPGQPLGDAAQQQGFSGLISPNELEGARQRIGIGASQSPHSINLGGGGALTNDAQFYQFPTRTYGQQAAQDTLLNAGLRGLATAPTQLPPAPALQQIPQLGQAPQLNPQGFMAQSPAQIPTFNPNQFAAQAPGQIPQVNPNQFGFAQPQPASVDKLSLGEFNFDPIEKLARQKFTSDTLPGIAERFTNLSNNRNSSARNNAISQAGVGLENQLAALRAQYGLQANQQALQQQSTLANLGLGNLNAANQYGLGNQQHLIQAALGNQGNLAQQQSTLANFGLGNQQNISRAALGQQGNLLGQQGNFGQFALGNQQNALRAAQGNQNLQGEYGLANQRAQVGQQGNQANYNLGQQRNYVNQQQVNQGNINQALNAGLAGQFENVYQPSQGNALGQLLGAGVGAAGHIGGAALGGYLGRPI